MSYLLCNLQQFNSLCVILLKSTMMKYLCFPLYNLVFILRFACSVLNIFHNDGIPTQPNLLNKPYVFSQSHLGHNIMFCSTLFPGNATTRPHYSVLVSQFNIIVLLQGREVTAMVAPGKSISNYICTISYSGINVCKEPLTSLNSVIVIKLK